MVQRFLSLLLALPLVGALVRTDGQSLPTPALDAFFKSQDPASPGIAFAISQGGRVIYSNAVGKADLSTGLPLAPSSDFRMASVTKQFTAMGILLLAREGRLSLKDPLRRWLPEMPAGVGSSVLLQHLMTHSSGLVDYESLIPASKAGQVLDADVLKMLSTVDSTYFPPGTQFRYSNSGFCLLALVIERASGQSYPDYIRDHIFRPLHMDSSTVYVDGVHIPHRAMGYSRDSAGRIQPSDQSQTSATKGDGGVYTSLSDYFLWAKALQHNALLNLPEVVGKLRFPIGSQAGSYYAAGWFLLEDKPETWFHSGSTCGFSNFVIRIPSEDWTLVYFSNVADNDGPFRELVRILKESGRDLSRVMALHDLTR